MNSSVSLRHALPSDVHSIAACNAAMARETEHKQLDMTKAVPGVEAVLNDSSKGFYIVAESEGKVIGQLMITYEWSDWRNGVFWWIQSVYVHPDFRRYGIFTKLYEYIHSEAKKDSSVCGIRLYVEKGNLRAQAVYEKIGMHRAQYSMYEIDFIL